MPLLPVSELAKLSPVFRGKAGNAFAGLIRRLLYIDKVSDLNDRHMELDGPAFAGALLDDIGTDCMIGGSDKLLELPEGPFITVSNHPYGGIDGIVLVDLIGHLKRDFKVMVNEFLARIEPLRDTWIVVNPKNDLSNGVTARNIQGVKEVISRLRDGHPVGFFPSGAVSDLSLKERCIRDREWQEPVLRLIQKAKVPILPVRFFDRNSLWFYLLGLVDWRIRILRLPREIVNKRSHLVRVGIGDVITVERQSMHQDPAGFGRLLRESVYGMPLPDDFVSRRDFMAGTF